jgi:hypothetical protein
LPYASEGSALDVNPCDLRKKSENRVPTFGAWIMRAISRIREELDRQIC